MRFILRQQNADGGFPLSAGGPSNAQSTAWGMQALAAAGRDLGKLRPQVPRLPGEHQRRERSQPALHVFQVRGILVGRHLHGGRSTP